MGYIVGAMPLLVQREGPYYSMAPTILMGDWEGWALPN